MFKRPDAFTLVELLAVIIVLGIILILAVPRVSDMINKYRDKAYKRQLDLILRIAEQYSIFYEDEINWDGDQAFIYLEDLQNKNLIANPLKNPKGGNFKSDRVIIILTRLANGAIDYEIEDLSLLPTLASITEKHMEEKNLGTSNEAFFYVGPNPNNWIEFGTIGEPSNDTPILWRIIKSNDEGIKIIYEGKKNGVNVPDDDGHITVNGADFIAWDRSGDSGGLNKWERPADLKDVLNNWYTTILTKNEQHIAPIKWCIGASGINEADYLDREIPLSELLETECVSGTYEYDVFGNIYIEEFLGETIEASGVGLIRASDYISTSNAEACTGSYFYDADMDFAFGNDCGIKDGISTNFLYKSSYLWWTHTAYAGSSSLVWFAHVSGYLGIDIAFYEYGIRPVLNLKSNILYDSGEGTISSPYKVK